MTLPMFDGSDYRPADHPRLASQYMAIFSYMSDGKWRTLREIADALGYPEASVSAQLRHMRKRRFGCNTVDKRHLGRGLFQYCLIPSPTGQAIIERSSSTR